MRIRLCCLLVSLVLCDVASAQGMVSLSIERGRLRIDGQRVPEALVPAPLDLRRVEGHLYYSGPADASIEIGGVRYRVEGQRFVLDREPVAPPDVVFDAGRHIDLRAGGYVFVPVDWASDPAEAQRLHFAAQQEFALDATAVYLAEQIRSMAAQDPEKTALIEQLRASLNDAFEIKQHNRLREIEWLEAELKFLRKQQQQRGRYRSEIVEQRLRALLAEQE